MTTDEGLNAAAVALGRMGGLKGGRARAEKLSPERRSEIAKKAAEARWAKPATTGVTITRLVRTSWACPSQWDAWDANDRHYHVRYQWGGFVVHRNAWLLVSQFVGKDSDGFMTTKDMLERMEWTLAPGVEVVYGAADKADQ